MAKSHVTPFEFDARMIEWNLKNKLITREQFEKYLSTLPDDGANTVVIKLDDEDHATHDSVPREVVTTGNGHHDA